ncbi:thioesterase family protein [Spirillospora sp. NPDC029432]|uniref:acyl-CoA thioesterase n=1 Tax=Spirillospora sp. NPDC029432 TaxID=3154599 RepID=UPI003453E333
MNADYGHWVSIQTRWKDNDLYGHVNNAVHYSLMDTAINEWMIERAGFRPGESDEIALCVESHCSYKAEVSFPDTIDLGLRIGRLGSSSVRWEAGLYRSDGTLVAEGYFVHVFVGRDARRPTPIPEPIRAEMRKLVPA